ncbi:MAG TPA: DUF4129 domain-containing protein [Candidatus Fraserbacteria bacterium]|nr:DUF4129 domain-containing protein [Candidatus Fraserbacteria bacterium]
MSERRKHLTIITGVLALGALVLLAAGLSSVRFPAKHFRQLLQSPAGPTFSGSLGPGAASGQSFWILLAAFFFLWALIILLVYRLHRSRRRPEYELVHEQPPQSRWMAWLVFILLLLGLVALGRWLFIHLGQLQQPSPALQLPAAPKPPPPHSPSPVEPTLQQGHFPGWLGLTLGGLLLLTLASGLGWLIWSRWAERLERSDDQISQLAELAGQAARQLEAGSALQDVVLRAYHQMSQVLSRRANLAASQLRQLTPREFEAALGRAGIRSADVTRLTRLFELVRYGEYHVDEAQRSEALSCLHSIEQSYGATEDHGGILGTTA